MDIYEQICKKPRIFNITPKFYEYLYSNKSQLTLYDVSNNMEGRKKQYTSHGEHELETFITDQEEDLIVFLTPDDEGCI